jgi:EAL domain-containing protein (putative c-di-GMP-specific phosphodiesterase class I)
VLEITETVLMKNTEAALKVMQALKALGIRLAIDDFGTGYSSLSYLQKFPLDVLKIPREFVEGLHGGKQPWALAKAILVLAETLQLRAIAEGVETLEEVEALRRIGCEFMQGYYFARPLGEAEAGDLLVQNLVHGLTLPIAAQGSPLLEAALHRERRAARGWS